MRTTSPLQSSSTHLFFTLLQVQPFWFAFTLRLEYILTRGAEVGHVDTHTPFTQGHHTSFGADGTNISTRQLVLLRDELLKVDIWRQVHLGRVQIEDLLLGNLIWVLEKNLSVDTSRTNQSGIQRIDLVCCHDHLDISSIIETVQLV
ncbi:26S protease regulatory subunit [Hortaea werneckii]|nr:26S protease regulatory subunit [Hortaea werneckii]